MPPRLDHKKSRNGCQRCKARKVKCDEARPTCRDCRRHRVPCVYVSRTSGHGKINGGCTFKEDEINSLNPNDRRLLELQLLHHFTSVVSQTIPTSDDPTTYALYKLHSVDLAFEHPVLLNSFLALSALHMIHSPTITNPSNLGQVSTSKDEAHPLISAVSKRQLVGPIDARTAQRMYLNLAVKQQQEAIENISGNKHATVALILATMFLSYQALGFWNSETSEEDKDFYHGPPIHWFRMIRGVAPISRTLNPDGDIPLINFMANKASKPDFSDKETLFNPDNVVPFNNLLNFEDFPEENMDSETETDYKITLAYIGGIHRGVEEKESQSVLFRRILAMAAVVPGNFLDYVDQQRPRALAILALYCSALSLFEDHWIFHGMAEREVRGIQTLLPKEWKWSLDLPRKILEEGKYRSFFANSL